MRFASILLLASLAGCASTGVGTRPPGGGTPMRASCTPRSRLVSPASRRAGDATLEPTADGFALAWAERSGDRGALRFLVVGKDGVPRSPSVEVVDAPAALKQPVIAVNGADGYTLFWSDAEGSKHRPLDARGRPRGDVEDAGGLGAAVSPGTQCGPAGPGIRCEGEGRWLELPAGSDVVAHRGGSGRLAVIARDGEGLKLWTSACPAP